MNAGLTLPEIATEDHGIVTNKKSIPLKIDFSAIRLSRDNPEERVFIQMLLKCSENLTSNQGPLAFVVFGRGRLLRVFTEELFEEKAISETCKFLAGPCACTIKAKNPGFDLLFSTAWDSALGSSAAAAAPASA